MSNQGLAPDDPLMTLAVRSARWEHVDGRLPTLIPARVINIDDPEKMGRFKCEYYFSGADSTVETDWIHRQSFGMGPTDMRRGKVFGFNPPHPEVQSYVILGCLTGDPHDLVHIGGLEYLQGKLGAPPTDKDDHKDWALRLDLQNGFTLGIDTEGNVFCTIPGNFRLKILGSGFISARGILTLFGGMLRGFAIGVVRLLGARVDTLNSPSDEEKAQLREMAIDAMKAPAGRKDPGIQKPEDLD